MKDNRKIIQVLLTLTIIFSIIGGSLAYFNWNTTEEQKTNVVFTLMPDFSCAADGGGNISTGDILLAPTTCTDTIRAIKRKVTVTANIDNDNLAINMDLWLNVNNIGAGLSASENFRYVLTTSSTSCEEGTIIASGNFHDTISGNKIKLLNQKKYVQTLTETYWLYIWLDAAETSSSTMNQTFSLSLGGSCDDAPIPYEEEILNGADPVLDDGMIPVIIDDDGTVKTANITKEWYNYENKEWANMVVVTDDSRSSYEGTIGTPVNEDDILGYYTWIPRFRYQVWTTTESSYGNETEIQVIFEDADVSMRTDTSIGSYRTHPAFWWDDNSNGVVDSGEMVSGIWVGKFETSGNATTPTIKPNKASLVSQGVSAQFATSQKISSNGNVYGLNHDSVNAHMMKNSERGAAAYLSRTKYGINGEVRINNYWVSSKTLTGCGASTENASQNNTECEIPYGSVEDGTYPQSTTGNISGIFDMSGGAWEYVMANYNSTIANSGFNEMPEQKYYDKYTISATNLCTLETCGGHALYETNNWYRDYNLYFVDIDNPWLGRGADYADTTKAGVFAYENKSGIANNAYSWRSVITIGYGI